MNDNKKRRLMWNIYRYIIYFLLIAFVVTCSFLLFLNSMQLDTSIIRRNAPMAFGNVLFLTLIFWSLDGIRRKLTIERPVKNIIKGLEKIMDGDFSVRIPPLDSDVFNKELNIVIGQINHMTAELSGVETLRTDFISNVSHEIKTPLAIIQNYGTMLQSPVLTNEEREEYAKAITDASKRLSGLVTNILKLNKLENQKIYPETKKYNLTEQICECLLAFEEVWEEKNIEIETDFEEDVEINADSELLSLVWNNLFSNAMKFTDNGGKVSVSLKVQNNRAVVSVSDNGCGMTAETGKHIFDKFYQGDTSHSAKGNGLGLALVKRVVDITGGDISVKSELGKGSTFTVKIPVNRP